MSNALSEELSAAPSSAADRAPSAAGQDRVQGPKGLPVASFEEGAGSLDILQIMAILPHRPPVLMIDRVLAIERKKRIVAIKNVTINEPHFAGHFPDYPIMPGVMIVEAIAQAGGALLLTEIEDRDDKLVVFTGIDNAKFRRPVTPGDQLRIEVTVLHWRTRAAKMLGVITVDGRPVCEATVMCQLVPRVRNAPPSASSQAEQPA